MGKFLRPVAVTQEKPQPITNCHECGWEFAGKHDARVPEKLTKRREYRTQVAISNTKSLCDKCYEHRLRSLGKSRYSNMTKAELEAWGPLATDVANCVPEVLRFM